MANKEDDGKCIVDVDRHGSVQMYNLARKLGTSHAINTLMRQ